MENIIKSLKYLPKLWTALSFLFLLLFALFLFFGRNFDSFKLNFLLEVFPNFYSHVSNFSLSFIVYITFCYVGLLNGLTIKHIVLIGLILILLNLLVELFVSILNTTDIIDAVYGMCGVIIGFLFLILVKSAGLVKNEL